MPRGREPAGEAPLSNAERQARHKEKHLPTLSLRGDRLAAGPASSVGTLPSPN
jgi:hypothetical protein